MTFIAEQTNADTLSEDGGFYVLEYVTDDYGTTLVTVLPPTTFQAAARFVNARKFDRSFVIEQARW